jgi:hypothetical protein
VDQEAQELQTIEAVRLGAQGFMIERLGLIEIAGLVALERRFDQFVCCAHVDLSPVFRISPARGVEGCDCSSTTQLFYHPVPG